jgi:hypothetical protein
LRQFPQELNSGIVLITTQLYYQVVIKSLDQEMATHHTHVT